MLTFPKSKKYIFKCVIYIDTFTKHVLLLISLENKNIKTDNNHCFLMISDLFTWKIDLINLLVKLNRGCLHEKA